MVPRLTRQGQKPVLHVLHIYTAIFGMHLFHFLPLLALGLSFLDAQPLKVDVSTLRNIRYVTI
jgi:hypothetical protein